MDIYAQYVEDYSAPGDVKTAYTNWLYDDSNIHWSRYVDAHSDLLSAFQKEAAPGGPKAGMTKWDWGAQHYSKYGKNEPRTLPKVVSTNGLPDIPGTSGRGGYTTITVQANNRTAEDVKSAFGKHHWEKAGVNEDRILKGPKLTTDSNGNLSVNTSVIGAQARQRYLDIANRFNNTGGGNYLALLNQSYNALPDNAKNEFQDNVRNSIDVSYIKRFKDSLAWDPSTTAQPPVGGFDPTYYAKQKPDAVSTYQQKASEGDLDFLLRYGNLDNYLRQDYTSVGRHQGIRGNDVLPEATEAWQKGAGGFVETLTDAEKQLYRDRVLGITTVDGREKIVLDTTEDPSKIDTTLEQEFAKVLGLTDLQKEKQFGALAQDVLRTSIEEIKKAKQEESDLAFMKGLPGYSEIMDINATLANSILGDTGIGGILNLTGNFKSTKRGLEKDIESLTGISSNSTIYNWQKWFDETLLKKYEDYEYDLQEYGEDDLKSLQKQAQEEIKNYEELVKTDPNIQKPVFLEIAENNSEGRKLDLNNIDDFKKILLDIDLKKQKEFVSSFVNGYLKPRFDQSKSMDEFISYLDVKEEEQNIFQSQTVVNKLKEIAELKNKSFLDLIQQAEKTKKEFDPDFYFDPLSKNTKELTPKQQERYGLQRDIVASDFDFAKTAGLGDLSPDGIDWAVEAYRYGFDGTYKTDPTVFARLHYQVKGLRPETYGIKDSDGESFLLDPAEDILPYRELEKKIKDFGKELAMRKELYGDASFMAFVTPEEYADSVLSAVDPLENKEEWQKILDDLGLDYTDDLSKVKDYLVEALHNDAGKTIRENIKYLNKIEEDLTQKTLGVTYIERPEDKAKVEDEEETALYSLFKKAGYGGTEDDFYTDFMPDVDRSEQQVISKTLAGKGLLEDMEDFSDPFAAFSGISSLMEEDASYFGADKDSEDSGKKAESSYFNIFVDDEEELPEKSTSAKSFLKDFTSSFAGFR